MDTGMHVSRGYSKFAYTPRCKHISSLGTAARWVYIAEDAPANWSNSNAHCPLDTACLHASLR